MTLEQLTGQPRVDLDLRVRGMGHSATVAINEHCDHLRRSGRDVFKLGLGQSPFPVPDVVVQALRDHAHEKDYLPVSGLRALRDQVAAYHRRKDRITRTGDDVLIGPGSKELMFLLQLVYYGDLVIPTPAWVSYAPQARMIGRQIQMVTTRGEHGWRLMPETLEEICQSDRHRPRLLILNYPSNPTGGTFEAAELKALADVARANRIVLLSDEIYGELDHLGQHESIAHYYPEGTIVSSGLSKWCGAGGWRLGTFLFPPGLSWLRESMAAAASETFTSTSAPIQYAAVRAFEGGDEIESYLRRSRRVLSALGRTLVRTLRMAGAVCDDPRGAFYLFPDLEPFRHRLVARGITTSAALCEKLLEDTGVAILPGVEFGRPPGEFTCRLAYVDFDGERALDGVGQALSSESLTVDDRADGDADELEFVRQYCPRVLEAIERMIEWLQAG